MSTTFTPPVSTSIPSTLGSAALPNQPLPRRAERPRPVFFSPARLGIYAFLISAALFFLLPLYVMGITSIKPMDEIRMGNIFALPVAITFEPWAQAWSSACTGLECRALTSLQKVDAGDDTMLGGDDADQLTGDYVSGTTDVD